MGAAKMWLVAWLLLAIVGAAAYGAYQAAIYGSARDTSCGLDVGAPRAADSDTLQGGDEAARRTIRHAFALEGAGAAGEGRLAVCVNGGDIHVRPSSDGLVHISYDIHLEGFGAARSVAATVTHTGVTSEWQRGGHAGTRRAAHPLLQHPGRAHRHHRRSASRPRLAP